MRRNMALFPIGTVIKLTGLTARQIRYYEQHELVFPVRNSGNQRLYSFNDVERLLAIKGWIEKGVNLAGVKRVLPPVRNTTAEETKIDVKGETQPKEWPKSDWSRTFRREMLAGRKRPHQIGLIQGELTRYFKI